MLEEYEGMGAVQSNHQSHVEPRPRNIFRRQGAIIFGAHLFLGIFAMTMAPLVDRNDWWWLAPFCLVSLVMLTTLITRSLRADPAGILYETGLFLAISSAVFFAFGPMLFVLGPTEAAEYVRSWYPVDASESVWLTGLNFVGLGLAGIAYVNVRFPMLERIADGAARGWASVSPGRVFIAFLVIGLATKYLFVLPFELRLTNSVPGSVTRQLAQLLTIALIIGWMYKEGGPRWMRSLANALLVEEVLVGFLMFNKTEVLTAVIAAALGYYFARSRLRTLLVAILAGLLIFVLIAPVVTFGRNELVARGGGVPAPANLFERVNITEAYFSGSESHLRQKEISGSWWSRLNYLPAQHSAVQLYDQGYGSDTLDRLKWIFVPRLLFRDKPEMTVDGIDLTEKVVGHRFSSTGIGVFVDGYYIFGWLGVLVASITYGLALRAHSTVARAIARRRALVMYPLVFLAISAGLRTTSWWLTGVIGPLVFLLAMLVLVRALARR